MVVNHISFVIEFL
jgi:hypothetical protein